MDFEHNAYNFFIFAVQFCKKRLNYYIMISKIYSPCTTIDEPQLRILLDLLLSVRAKNSFTFLSEHEKDLLNEFIVIFRSHLPVVID